MNSQASVKCGLGLGLLGLGFQIAFATAVDSNVEG